jgi:Fuc2NAc and GlcNAc transferase
MDDHRPIPAKWRLLAHFLASGFALYCLGGVASLIPSSWNIPGAGLVINFVALVYLVWTLNLYNFMDGINGLAAVEAVTVCLGGALIYGLQGYNDMVLLPLVLAVVVAGFLFWNFPVARIFMGDVGSGFLGLMIGIFSIQAAHVHMAFFWGWLILSGVFIVDATLTLLRRIFNGSRIDEPHRQHAYQRAVDLFESHVKVTMAVLVINLVWLLPIAILVGRGYLHGVIGLLMAYLPLIVLVFQFSVSMGANDVIRSDCGCVNHLNGA